MSPRETPLERRQRMSETAAYGPLSTSEEWELDGGVALWSSGPPSALSCRLDDLVDALAEPMRSVVELRMWGRETFEAIADQLELSSRGHAHVLWTRAIEKLREGLTADG